MRKLLSIMVASVFIFGSIATASAAMPRSIDKLVKGITNVVESPIVLFSHTKKEMDKADHLAYGLGKGLLTAPFHAVKKAGDGIVDIATFPIE